MKLTDLSYLLMDGQTTGLSAARSEIIELGWSLSLHREEVQARFIRPSEIEKVSAAVWQVTGLSPDQVRAAPDAETVWTAFFDAVVPQAPSALVIHYAQFEMPFFKKLQQKVFGDDAVLPWPLLDTYKIAQRTCPHLPSKTLRALAGHWGFVVPESNRASDHVIATQIIWKNLMRLLEERHSITTLPELQTWLTLKPASRKATRTYLFAREDRLALAEGPGVYEMFSSAGQTLYIGKATSLRSRVNSYFTQRRSKRSRLHELMTQVADIKVTPTVSALEAAILENDRIKEISPPYNVSLRPNDKPLQFYSRDLTSAADTASPAHPWGPFPHEPFESLQQLQAIAIEDWEKVKVWWLQHPIEDFHAKMGELAHAHGLNVKKLTLLNLIHVGKKILGQEAPADEIEASIHRKLKRAVRAIHRMRWLAKLSRCQVSWRLASGEWRTLHFEEGEIARASTGPGPEFREKGHRPLLQRQSGMDKKQLDRVRILLTELTLFLKKGVPFELFFSKTRRFPNSWLARVGKPLPEDGKEEAVVIADSPESRVEQTSA